MSDDIDRDQIRMTKPVRQSKYGQCSHCRTFSMNYGKCPFCKMGVIR